MTILVLGRAEDCLDYRRYCDEHGIAVEFCVPPVLGARDAADWADDALADLRASGLDTAPDDVLAFHDVHQVQAELLRARMSLSGRDPAAVATLTDKTLFKTHPAVRDLVGAHRLLPLSLRAAEALAVVREELRFPLVLKPSNGFYSAGVVRVDEPEAFPAAFIATKRVCGVLRRSRGDSAVIAEEYLSGGEFAVDGVVSAGRVFPLLMHRKRPELVGPYFHETAYLTEPFDAGRGADAARLLRTIIQGVGLDDSPFHAEFRYDGSGRLHVLGVAPRLSGSGPTAQHLLGICTGLDAYAMLYQLTRGPVRPVPGPYHVGLEYDAAAPRSGVLQNVDEVVELCRRHGAIAVLQHRANGHHVLGPPLNFEAVVTGFFAAGSLAEGEALVRALDRECDIKTKVGG